MSIDKTIREMAQKAKEASKVVSVLDTNTKNKALERIAQGLVDDADLIKKENQKDLTEAKEKGLSAAMIDRLTVSDAVIESMAKGLRDVAALRDPVGEVTGMWLRPNGLQVGRVRIPLGVIGMIYEARPNATVDAAGLCLKAGNAVILRGGSEAFHSNTVLARIIQQALGQAGIPQKAAQVVPVREREAVNALLNALGSSSASAMALIKRQLYELDGRSFEEGIALGAKVNAVARATPDFKESVSKFLKK